MASHVPVHAPVRVHGRRDRAARRGSGGFSPIWRWLLALALGWTAVTTAAASGSVLALPAGGALVDAWSHVRVLDDAAGRLDARAALAAGDAFAAPAGALRNLGLRDGPVWLRVALALDARDDGRWVLDIDYPMLDRVDVHVVVGGRIVRSAVLGDSMAFVDRPLATRSLALSLRLPPGEDVELLLRVQTEGTTIVPLRLVKPAVFHARESRLQMLQGVFAGIHLCLVAYAAMRGFARRESTYLFYAAMTAGSGLFLFAFHGLAAQHLWPENAWLASHASPLAVLVGIAGALALLDRLFDARTLSPRLTAAARAAALVAATCAVALAAGALDYRQAQMVASVLGPLPMVAAVPLAAVRWRRGDPAAAWVLAGWGASAAGATVLVLLLGGLLDAAPLTQHAYQAGWLLQALTWLRVLDLRDVEQAARADRAEGERRRLQTLARTDPLTALPNRRGLEAALAAWLPAATAENPLALYLIDLDGFKSVNDALGHEAGDRLLAAVGRRLRGALRQDDAVARLGGDEFVVLARGLRDEAAAAQFGERLLRAFDEPFDLGDGACRVGLTIGFVLAPEDGCDEATLLRGADAAMYVGKRGGKRSVRRVALAG